MAPRREIQRTTTSEPLVRAWRRRAWRRRGRGQGHARLLDLGGGSARRSRGCVESASGCCSSGAREGVGARHGAISSGMARLPPSPNSNDSAALRLFRARTAPSRAAAAIEETLEDRATGLFGRPDRVEGDGADRVVVDLKTGLHQGGATESQRRQLLLYAHLVNVATGDRPTRVAIEDPAGRRWEESITEADVAGAVDEVLDATSEFQLAIRDGAWEGLASPSSETCRRCPYRLVCSPYWKSLDVSWGQGSVAGEVTGRGRSPAGSITEMCAVSPVDASGEGWLVSATPAELGIVDERVAIVDAEITGTDRLLRWRWSTMSRGI